MLLKNNPESLVRKLEEAARALAEASQAVRAALDELRSRTSREGPRAARPARSPLRSFEPSQDDRPHTNDPAERWPGMPAAALSAATEALSLVQDVDHILPTLEELPARERAATVAVLAGRGRRVQARMMPFGRDLPPSFWTDMRVFFGKLTTFTKRVQCEWIEALSTQWETDWDLYIRYHSRRLEEGRGGPGQTEPLSHEELTRLLRDRLRAVLQLPYPAAAAEQLIAEARRVIGENDPLLLQAARAAGVPLGNGDSSALQPAPAPAPPPPTAVEADAEEPGDDIGNRIDPPLSVRGAGGRGVARAPRGRSRS